MDAGLDARTGTLVESVAANASPPTLMMIRCRIDFPSESCVGRGSGPANSFVSTICGSGRPRPPLNVPVKYLEQALAYSTGHEGGWVPTSDDIAEHSLRSRKSEVSHVHSQVVDKRRI